jgi:enoyl-CoA hydratase/carnithine racemase
VIPRPPARGARRARRSPAVEVAVRDGVAWVTMARPETGNRLDAAMMGGLADAAATVDAAGDVDVVVLGARGDVFSGGLAAGCRWPEPAWPDGVAAIAGIAKPVVAALPGPARGWGFSLALACDLRVVVHRAVLAVPDAGAAGFPGGGLTQRLPRIVGTGRALDVLLLGTPVSARCALAWGLAHAVVPATRLTAEAARLAALLRARGPLALRLAKEAVQRALDLPLADGMRLEEDLYVLLQTTADRAEGVRAFLDRRPPRFAGR